MSSSAMRLVMICEVMVLGVMPGVLAAWRASRLASRRKRDMGTVLPLTTAATGPPLMTGVATGGGVACGLGVDSTGVAAPLVGVLRTVGVVLDELLLPQPASRARASGRAARRGKRRI